MITLFDQKRVTEIREYNLVRYTWIEVWMETRLEAICILVSLLKECAGDKQAIAHELINRCELSPQVAEEIVERYWDSEVPPRDQERVYLPDKQSFIQALVERFGLTPQVVEEIIEGFLGVKAYPKDQQKQYLASSQSLTQALMKQYDLTLYNAEEALRQYWRD